MPSPFASMRVLPAVVLALSCASCISISETSNYDFGFEERFQKATREIVERSARAEEAATRGRQATVSPEAAAFVQRHFAKADELVMAQLEKQAASRGVLGDFFLSFDEYARRRKALLAFTLKLQPSLQLVEARKAGATAFPSGKVLVNRPLAEGFEARPDGLDPVLLGILVHELIHVRDGHALEQWGTADSRKAWATDGALGALSNVTAVIPFLSIKYDIQYPLTYGAVRQLPSLSEFAADFGAVSLLNRAGYDSGRYIAFLAASSEEAMAAAPRNARPGLLQERVRCLRLLASEHFETDIRLIAIGSREAGDQQVVTLNVAEQRPSPTLAFGVCAIRSAFADIPLVDGVLTTPTFDVFMLFRYA